MQQATYDNLPDDVKDLTEQVAEVREACVLVASDVHYGKRELARELAASMDERDKVLVAADPAVPEAQVRTPSGRYVSAQAFTDAVRHAAKAKEKARTRRKAANKVKRGRA